MTEIEKLSEFQHARRRTEMYLSSRDPNTQTVLEYSLNGVLISETTWVPALFVAFREVFDNAIDEIITHSGGDRIDITYSPDDLRFVIEDNGRGIPINYVEEYGTYAATMALSETRAGRNFDDGTRGNSRGLNGVGASVVNFVSEYFQVDIFRDGKHFNQMFREGDEHIIEEAIIVPQPKKGVKKNGTRIEFKLSQKVFKHLLLPEVFIRARVYEAALCYPKLKLFFNGKQIKVNGQKELFPSHKPIEITIGKDDSFLSRFWLVPDFFDDGRDHTHGLVNAIPVFNGGIHVDTFKRVFFGGLLKALESKSKKKKLSPNRDDILKGMLIYNITEMAGPHFDSQSKTRLINEGVGKIVQTELTNPDFFETIIKKYPDFIEGIYERCALRTMARDSKDVQKAARANKRLKIVELEDASGNLRTRCTLFLCEGRSAVSGITEARDPIIHGALPLRGKIMNAYGKHLSRAQYIQHMKECAESDTLKKIASAVGLVVGDKAPPRGNLRYGKVYIATDADPDGANIAALLVNYFYQFWPELFEPSNPFIYIFQTPFIIAKKGKVKKYWYSDNHNLFNPEAYKGWEITRAKGLAALKKDDWQNELANPRVTPVVDDGDLAECMKLLFSPDADARKDWLAEDQ